MIDVVMHQYQLAPVREIVRDRRGVVIGRIERKGPTGKLVARTRRGEVAGVYDPRSGETRDQHGRLIGRLNLLPVLLFGRR